MLSLISNLAIVYNTSVGYITLLSVSVLCSAKPGANEGKNFEGVVEEMQNVTFCKSGYLFLKLFLIFRRGGGSKPKFALRLSLCRRIDVLLDFEFRFLYEGLDLDCILSPGSLEYAKLLKSVTNEEKSFRGA